MSKKNLGGEKNGRINKTGMIFGVISLLTFIIVRNCCDDTYEILHIFDASDIIPPLWIINLFSFIWGFLIGYAAGVVFDCISYGGKSIIAEISAYRGGLFFIISLFLSHAWYLAFFQNERIFLAIFLIIIALISSIMCAFFWSSTLRSSALILGSYGIWLFYLFILNMSVLLHI